MPCNFRAEYAGAITLACLVIIACGDPGAKSQAAEPMASKIEAYILELGDKSFTVRKHGADELRKIGYLAVPALEAAAKSDDPEVAATAGSILNDARLGVSSSWPDDLVLEIRKYDELNAGARENLTRRVISEMKEEAIPFILVRLASGDKAAGQCVYDALKQLNNEKIAERLTVLLKEPKNEWQARAVAWAYLCRKQPQEALRVLVACRVEGEPRQSVIEQAVKDLCSRLRKNEYDEVEKNAGSFAQAAPEEARFLYLRAAALRQVNMEKEALELEEQASKLNPAQEAPHYTAGDMLMDLGLQDVSKREWEAILKIDPVDDVYDINAFMRLGQIAARGGHNEEAARNYEAGLNIYRKRKAGGQGGYGMIGTSEEGLEAMIRKLRREGGEAGEGMKAGQHGKQLQIQLRSIVKDGKNKELANALKSSTTSMGLKTEPLGIRVLDLKECRLAYDRKTEKVSILLNGSDTCKPQNCPLGGKKTKVAVTELDCVHIFEIDPDSAEVTKLDRFEKDYEVKIIPDESLREYKGFDIKIGDKEYSWKELLNGTTVDYLPPVLDLKMEGPAEDTTPEILQFKIKMEEKIQ